MRTEVELQTERRFDRIRRLTIPPCAPSETGAVLLDEDLNSVLEVAEIAMTLLPGDKRISFLLEIVEYPAEPATEEETK